MYKNVFPILFVLIIILVQTGNAGQRSVIQTNEVALLFEEQLRNAAKEVVEMFPGVKMELEKTLGWRLGFRPTVLLINNSSILKRMDVSSLIVAVAIPQKNLIVIDHSKVRTPPFRIRTILKHELCHLLLHQYIPRENLPRWLDEGIAQWISDSMGEIIMDRKRSFLNEAILSENYLSINELTVSFPRDNKSLLLAYEESKSFIEYVNGKFGRQGVLDILKYLKMGYKVDAAVMKSLSIPLDELEKRWHGHLRKRTTWITYMTANLYEILFFLAALITIYGFVKLLIKKKHYKDEDDEGEMSIPWDE